jgi:hypothetical protein
MTSAMDVRLRWMSGGEAVVLETDGTRAVLRSDKPAAPGTPLVAEVMLRATSSVRFKVQECRRQHETWFEMRGRWMDLSRAARQELVAEMSAGKGS